MAEMELAAARHGCKVCGKSFSSGRSLGGHMRSHHLPLGDAAAAAEGDTAATDKLVARASANGERTSDGEVIGYGLRENPRKTRRLSDFAGDEVEDGGGDGEQKACRVCGKLFPSWRSLFEHMRGHASGDRDRGEEEEEDVDVEVEEEFVPDAAEAEEAEMAVAAAVPALAVAPRRRRRTMRVAAPPPAPPPPPPPPPRPVPCGFEKEPEPEDVALCLLMLSRDTGRLWSTPVKQEPFERRAKKPPRGNSDDAKVKGRVVPKGSRRKRSSPPTPKRTRYECPGCGKVFSSYQALGGHRASHKRINTSCSAPKVSVSVSHAAASPAPEPSAETYDASCSTLSPSASPDSVVIGFGNPNTQGKFECPVCFVVFSSGKALGGHKLSHLVPAGGAEQEHEQHSAGFLDLNFPPDPPEEA